MAAFVHYLFSRDRHSISSIGHDLRCMIFDFGGGTCDVAVFSISLKSKEESIRVSPLAVSRYHKLGGADIDRTVVYECQETAAPKEHDPILKNEIKGYADLF